MSKSLYIAEKPSVAQQFADALKIRGRRGDGYIESDEAIVTWCVGHLVTMSYPEAYDMKYKRWSLNTLPFLPKEFKYEVIPSVEKQFSIVKCRYYLCLHRLRTGRRVYLPSGSPDGWCKGQAPEACVDRLPDRRGDPSRDPGSKR